MRLPQLTVRTRLFLLAGLLVVGVAVTGIIALFGSGTLANRVRVIGNGMTAVSTTANQRGEKLAQAGDDSLRLGALSGQLGDEAGRLRQMTIFAAREAGTMRGEVTAALATTTLRLLDRRLDNAKFLGDAMIKAADVRNAASGFIRALGREFGVEHGDADAATVAADEEQRYSLLDFLESLVSSAGADVYAVIGCTGDLDGRVLASNQAVLFKRDLSDMALVQAARHNNRVSRGVDRLGDDLILGSVALMRSSGGQDVALLLCGYSLNSSALRTLDQDLGARLAVFLPDSAGTWQVRHSTLVDADERLIKAVPFPAEIASELRTRTLKAQIAARDGNQSVVDVMSLRAACRLVQEIEIDGAVYSAVWQGLIADSGALVGVLFIGRDVTAAVADEQRILKGAEAAGAKAREIADTRDQILASTRANQEEAKILAEADSQARDQVNRAVADADRIAGLTRNGVGVALVLALVVFVLTSVVQYGLRRTLAEVGSTLSATVERLGGVASTVASSGRDLTANSNQQASSMASARTSLEAVRNGATGNAVLAGQAQERLERLLQRLDEGLKAIHALQQSMGSITQASQQTAAVVNSINDIAFQTTILAVNATIESSRAGEAGRGFQVVARGVKALAKRASTQVRTTAELVAHAQKQTGSGVGRVEELLRIANEMATSADEVREAMTRLAEDSREQQKQVSEIAVQMVDAARLAEDNRQSAERAGNTTMTLGEQVRELDLATVRLRDLLGVARNSTQQVPIDKAEVFGVSSGTESGR